MDIARKSFHATISLAYSKPYKEFDTINYDEHEWRYVIPDGASYNSITYFWLWSKEEFEEWRGDINKPKEILKHFLFLPEYITYIIIPESDKHEIYNFIENPDRISGHCIDENLKQSILENIIVQ